MATVHDDGEDLAPRVRLVDGETIAALATEAEREAARHGTPMRIEVDGVVFAGTAILTSDDRLVGTFAAGSFVAKMGPVGAEQLRKVMRVGDAYQRR